MVPAASVNPPLPALTAMVADADFPPAAGEDVSLIVPS